MNNDEQFLRVAIELARQAGALGDEPFGAVLVEHDQIVQQSYNHVNYFADPTAHAELNVIQDYCRAQRRMSLAGCTLYCSTEPCPMCAGAIHWSRISRVVYSISQSMIQAMSGGSTKPPCDTIINSGGGNIEIVGLMLADEGLAVFEGYTFRRRMANM